MTDLATRPGADGASTDDPAAETATYEWAPAESAGRKRHLGLWIGIPLGIAAVGLAAASLILIAPGTSVAGVPVGGLTAGAAADVIDQSFASTTIVLTGEGGDAAVTAADLGATIDARALANTAYSEHPAWNLAAWNAPATDVVVEIDPVVATAAMRAAAPELFTDPVDATIAFDDDKTAYVTTDAVPGTGVDVEVVRAALQDAFASGAASVDLTPVAASVDPHVPTFAAEGAAASANGIIKSAGFYVGKERVVPVSRERAASWLTVTQDDRGGFQITADQAAIQEVVDTLKDKVDRKAVTASVITDSDGKVLETLKKGVSGRTLATTTGVAAAYAAQLGSGDGRFVLDVAEQPFKTIEKARLLEVDLSQQRLYLKENGKVVDSWLISSGAAPSPTKIGHFKIGWRTPSQTMSSSDPNDPYWNYSAPNTKWVMYFNSIRGGQAFHGVYWHSNWGIPTSHGCVGMSDSRAKQLYAWTPSGTDVWIHA